VTWAEPFEKRTWAIESAGGLGYLLAQPLPIRSSPVDAGVVVFCVQDAQTSEATLRTVLFGAFDPLSKRPS
jgi:hypothetical protein